MTIKVGNSPSNVDFSMVETYMLMACNVTVPIGQFISYTVGTFTMPFTGYLTASFLAKVYWHGPTGQGSYWFRCRLDNSSPAPNGASLGFFHWNGTPGDFNYWTDLSHFANWGPLTKGTVVTVVATADAGGQAGTSVTWPYIGGRLRAYAT